MNSCGCYRHDDALRMKESGQFAPESKERALQETRYMSSACMQSCMCAEQYDQLGNRHEHLAFTLQAERQEAGQEPK
jgi:hypothetical protein